MQEDFQTSRSNFVHLSAGKCPFATGNIRPYHNMRSRTSIDPDTFGSTSVGTSAGSVKPGGTYSSLDEMSFVKHRMGLRGGDVNTNTGVETFTNTHHNYQPWSQSSTSVMGRGLDAPLYNRPVNMSNRNMEAFISNPVNWT